MQDISFGQRLLLIAFILVPVINLLLKRMQRGFERQPPREESPRQPAPRTFAEPPTLEVIASARERVPTPEMAETAPRPGSRACDKSFFRSRRDLRRAIIMIAVLGSWRGVYSRTPRIDY
jgi:hypothetical protein